MSNASRGGASGRITIRDVAARAGVSTGTVSRVVAGNSRISEATRLRVSKVMAELGYEPNAAARTMRTNVTKAVGLLIPDITCPVFSGVMAGAEEVLDEQNYLLFAFSSDNSPKREVAFLQAARQRSMDGLIVSIYDETAEETIRNLRAVGVPMVIVDRDVAVDADRIDVEHESAMRSVMQHLITLGHQRIGIIGASRNRPGRTRIRVFREELARAGIAVDEDLVRVNCGSEDGTDYGAGEAHDLLTGPEPPTALIAAGSVFFAGALRSIRALGLEIPRDLSFVGADHARLGEIAGPAITVIDRDMREAGRQAARLLLDRFAGVSLPPRRVLLTSNVLLRRSVGPVDRHAPGRPAAPADTVPARGAAS